jgi:hypothetical protein
VLDWAFRDSVRAVLAHSPAAEFDWSFGVGETPLARIVAAGTIDEASNADRILYLKISRLLSQ